jgi:hypothetical protein
MAQFEAGSEAINVNIGWAIIKVTDSQNRASGFEAGGNFESLISDKVSLGIGLSLFRVEDEFGGRKTYYQSTPITFHGKYFFGSDMSKGYLKGLLGAHFSNTEFERVEGTVKSYDGGVVLGLGIGLHQFLGNSVYIKPAYEFKWLDNTYIKGGLVHSFFLGMGFQF